MFFVTCRGGARASPHKCDRSILPFRCGWIAVFLRSRGVFRWAPLFASKTPPLHLYTPRRITNPFLPDVPSAGRAAGGQRLWASISWPMDNCQHLIPSPRPDLAELGVTRRFSLSMINDRWSMVGGRWSMVSATRLDGPRLWADWPDHPARRALLVLQSVPVQPRSLVRAPGSAPRLDRWENGTTAQGRDV